MKHIFPLWILTLLAAAGAVGDLQYAKSGSNTPLFLTPVNGRVLYWNGTVLGNLDIAGTYQPLDAALSNFAAGSDHVKFSGPATSVKTFALPNADATLLYAGGDLGTPSGGNLSLCGNIPLSEATGTLESVRGGTGVSNAGTFTNASNLTVTGGGTIALGGFTATIPATGTLVIQGGALGTPSSGTLGMGSVTLSGTMAQFNTAASDGDFAFLGAANTFTAAQTNSTAGAASTPALKLSGVPFAGTGTTSFPLVYINDANATASTTLNTAGTYFGINGDGTQTLMNLMKDGVSQFKVSGTALVEVPQSSGGFADSNGAGFRLDNVGLIFGAAHVLGWSNNNTIVKDTGLSRKTSTANWIKAGNGTANDATATFEAGDLISSVVGKGLQIKGGSALARAGNATLVGGTVTVSNTTITANSIIYLTRKTAGGSIGDLTYTLSAATSFTINSASGTDTSTVSFVIIELN